MLKRIAAVLVIVFAVGLCGCGMHESVLWSLPIRKSSNFYTSGGFQDFTDYGVYTFYSISPEDIERTKKFEAVDDDDVHEILEYIDDFEGWVEICGGELKENYDFDKLCISAGDYVCLYTKEGEPIGRSTYGKFDSYTIFIFDTDTLTLYYFHSNIRILGA